MIPNIQTSRYESNVNNVQHAFTIEMTPTLAKLLSSQTYTDKLLAAIREPLSNAYDSHVRAANLDAPARLHLPTILEPQFTLRDFGTGLSHEDVIRLFFSYGVSDKRHTNAELGGLGIGAKAFFAYVDQATITSYYNGIKRTYSASKAANGLPQGMLVSQVPTAEPNGLELTYPVQPRHCDAFREKTQELLTHLRLQVECNVTLKPETINSFYSADIDTPLGTAHCVQRTKRQENIVVMGGIAYAIPMDVDNYHASTKYKNNYRGDGVIIHLPIGSVEISASRESLSPTDADKDLIVDILHNFKNKLRSEDWTTKIAESDNWLAAVAAREFLGYMHAIDGSKIQELDRTMAWGGISTRGLFLMPDLSAPVKVIYRYAWRSNKCRSTTYSTDYSQKKIDRVFWIPTRKKISWANWYEHNRSMTSGSQGAIDLHIRTDTHEEAQIIANIIGITAEVEDGSFLQVTTPKKGTIKNSRPTGLAWIGGGKQRLDDYNESDLIYTNEPSVIDSELGWMVQHDILTTRPVCFRAYGASTSGVPKQFAHLPTTLLEWCRRNPDKIDEDKWREHQLLNALYKAWRPCWMPVDRAINDRKEIGFPVTLKWRHRNSLPRLYDKPDITHMFDAVQQWHDKEFASFPKTLRKYLRNEISYVCTNHLFDVYNEMKS